MIMNNADPEERGELIGTTFWNKSMPLIRYRTDDYAGSGRAYMRLQKKLV